MGGGGGASSREAIAEGICPPPVVLPVTLFSLFPLVAVALAARVVLDLGCMELGPRP